MQVLLAEVKQGTVLPFIVALCLAAAKVGGKAVEQYEENALYLRRAELNAGSCCLW